MESNNGEVFMGIDKNEWGFRVGHLPHGERNKISDVPGVTVGHCTLADGDIQTGVTALLPHPGDVFHDKVLAACHVINGFGKTTGLVQIDELGTLETPILFTNTLSVGTVETALVKYMLERNPDICETTGSVNPVVCECNDCGLNDIRGLHVTEAHVAAALADCKADFAEGAVDKALLPMEMLHDDAINPLFRAVAECVEESVLSSLLHAETVTGYHGRTVQCLSDLLKK